MTILKFALGLAACALSWSSLAHADFEVTCESEDRRYTSCYVGERFNEVRLLRQLSDARCSEGYSFGLNRGYVWVDHGCRGVFEVSRGYGRRPDIERCESESYGYTTCFVGRFYDVDLYRQLSDVSCREGYSWGVFPREGYIWVDNGCRAEFLVERYRRR